MNTTVQLLPQATTTTEAITPRPFWQAEPCPAWCQSKHEDGDFYADRDHFWSAGDELELTLYHAAHGGDEYGPGTMTIMVSQHHRASAPEIELAMPTAKAHMYIVDGVESVRMTIAEAHALRDRLAEIIATLAKEAADLWMTRRQGCARRNSAMTSVGT